MSGGLSRRELLGWSAAALGGLVASACIDAAAAEPATAKHCIWIWLNGGPSHIDTFDPKPGTKVGGPFKAIAARTKGLQLSEHLPRLAECSNLFSVIRSMSTKEGNHQRARHLMHTGYVPNATVMHPSLGGWVSRELGQETDELPSFVSVGGQGEGAGFLGVQYGPLVVRDPKEPPENSQRAPGTDEVRFAERLSLLDDLEARFLATTGTARVSERRGVFQRAVRLMRAPRLGAFTVADDGARARYGDSDFGRGCLLARRLIEAGVRFVEVTLDGWDTHQDNFTRVKALMGTLDTGLSALLAELDERKRLDETLVVVLGDFGRTPKINADDGRDHYPQASSLLVSGGGLQNGLVYGATDAEGATVAQPVKVPDLFATFVQALGIDPQKARTTPFGRPIAITDYGQPIDALLRR